MTALMQAIQNLRRPQSYVPFASEFEQAHMFADVFLSAADEYELGVLMADPEHRDTLRWAAQMLLQNTWLGDLEAVATDEEIDEAVRRAKLVLESVDEMSRVDMERMKDLAVALKCAADRGDVEEAKRLLYETMARTYDAIEIAAVLTGILVESIRTGLLRSEDVRRAMIPLWLAIEMNGSTNSDSAGDEAAEYTTGGAGELKGRVEK